VVSAASRARNNARASLTAEQVWGWLGAVADPEIPVISIVDLGIVRHVSIDGGACMVTITPTYSGCPAMAVIADAVIDALHSHGVQDVKLETRIAPAWTTDWMSERGKYALSAYGIAPPAQQAIDISGLRNGLGRRLRDEPAVGCPHCGSVHTAVVSRFGSTPCKALYKCLDCLEPFDHFKCH
jgi:ring-1,2-phenylacetyl-CoA epoxidase subunit PaaD